MIDIDDMDQVTQALFFRILSKLQNETESQRRTEYVKQAQLIWHGAHYLMVRTGPLAGVRSVSLWSREWLLLEWGNPGKNGMIELALAAIDPCHRFFTANKKILLWTSDPRDSQILAGFQGRRWSKALAQDLCSIAERYEREFPAKEAEESARQQSWNNFSRSLIEGVEARGFRVTGPKEYHGFTYPVNHEYKVALASRTNQCVRLRPHSDLTVDFSTMCLTLTSEEANILLDAIETIEARRTARSRMEEEESA